MSVLDYLRISDREFGLGAAASEETFEIPKGRVTNMIRFAMVVEQDGATVPTLSDFLTQLGSEIAITVSNKTVIKVSPTDLMKYIVRKKDIFSIAPLNDGTGADNQDMLFVFDLPLCPLDKHEVNLKNPDYGFDGASIVFVKLTYPADANEMDVRKLDVYSVQIPDSRPTKVVEIEKSTKTFASATEGQRINISQKTQKALFDLMIQQTSYISEGITDDLRTISELELHDKKEVALYDDIEVEHVDKPVLGSSNSAITMLQNDEYRIIPFHHSDDAKNATQLTGSNDLVVDVGVAEALNWWQIRLVALSDLARPI